MRVGLLGLCVVAAVLSVVLGAPSVGGATPSTTRVYNMSGTTTNTPGGGCSDCLAFSSATTGSATCSACLPGDPLAGSFTLSMPTITTYQSNPCKIKTMSGTLMIDWDDGNSSTAPVSGRFIDDKLTLHLAGTFDVSSLLDWSAHQLGIVLKNYPNISCGVETTNPVSAVLVISG